jgi:hypothetical protein
MSYHYAILMETSGKENESWYNFIRYEGNEDNLRYLEKQLSRVDPCILDELSMFTLEINHLVSEQTAREMCLVDLNAGMFHRKFDGTLKKIRFDLSKRDDNEERIEKIYDMIGGGDIDKFVDGEEEFSGDKSSSGSDKEEEEDDNGHDSDVESEKIDTENTNEKKKDKKDKKKDKKDKKKDKNL